MIGGSVTLTLGAIEVADDARLTVRDGDTRTVKCLGEIDAPERTRPHSQVSRRNIATPCRQA
jgi:hypothetical protein